MALGSAALIDLAIAGAELAQGRRLERGVAAVVVGKTAQKRIDAAVQSGRTDGAAGGSSMTAEQKKAARKEQERRQQNKVRLARFAWEVATPAFFQAVEGIKAFEVLHCLVDMTESYNDWGDLVDGYPAYFSDEMWAKTAKLKPAARMQSARSWLVFEMLYRWAQEPDDHNKKINKKYVATFAANLQKLAEQWDVKLPKGWLEKAAEYDSMELQAEEAEA